MSDEYEEMQDPFDAAINSPVQEKTYEYWGQMTVDDWFCGLRSKKDGGNGKEPYDPQIHKKRYINVDTILHPLSDMGLQFSIERTDWRGGMLVGSYPTWWHKGFWPSARDAGANGKDDLNNKWMHVVLEKTGEIYKKDGETVYKTHFKILEIYENEEACRTAYLAENGDNTPATEQSPALAPMNDAKKTALVFVEKFMPIWKLQYKTAGFDSLKDYAAEQIKSNTLINPFWSIDDPEVVSLIEAE